MNTLEIMSDADNEIFSCLNLDHPKSFFLFAGAGSGKTHSLVSVLKRFQEEKIHRLRLHGQKIAVITYTNAACDEIKRRLEFDSTFVISTIHSFAWELIRPYQKDIKDWVRNNTQKEIAKLEEEQRKGRAGTKAASDRLSKIKTNQKRLENLDKVKAFSYNPNGINSSKDSLNHAEVIKISSDFLSEKPLMQQILVKKYPILLIDESQDTKKELMDAFFKIQKKYSTIFLLGLFGDTMQRIYTDGKTNLGENIPDDWAKPAIKTNYRCPKRVITLINKIRLETDRQAQIASDKNVDGIVRLFIVDSNSVLDKQTAEKNIARQMSELTLDDGWKALDSEVKILTIEHHMAAKRGGFADFFEPLYNFSSDSTGLLDGTMHGIPFLIHQILPLVKAKQKGNEFRVAQIVKSYSPLLDKDVLKTRENPIDKLREANAAVESLYTLWNNERDPSLFDILIRIKELNLFPLPETLSIIAHRPTIKFEEGVHGEEGDPLINAWEAALISSFGQLEKYAEYISDNSSFGTHQGVKGLQFPRVMVILDDDDARGWSFSYDKLLGAKELTSTDQKNIDEGKETIIDRTRRLFYVTCSRAEKSLAIVAYTKAPDLMKNFVISQGWFSEDEIITEFRV